MIKWIGRETKNFEYIPIDIENNSRNSWIVNFILLISYLKKLDPETLGDPEVPARVSPAGSRKVFRLKSVLQKDLRLRDVFASRNEIPPLSW